MASYMFSGKEITPTTWIDLQKLVCEGLVLCEDIDACVAQVVDDSGDFCFIFWDEVGQMSNPYETVESARAAAREYSIALARTDLSGW